MDMPVSHTPWVTRSIIASGAIRSSYYYWSLQLLRVVWCVEFYSQDLFHSKPSGSLSQADAAERDLIVFIQPTKACLRIMVGASAMIKV